MKNLTYLFCLIAFTFLLACGEDSVTNNPVPPPDPVTVDTVTLFTKDSIYFNQNFPVQFGSVTYLSNVLVDTLHVEFTFHTFDIRSKAIFKINSDTLINYDKFSNVVFDTSFSVNFIVNQTNFLNYFYIIPDGSFHTGSEFGSLRNIKLWYIRRS